MTSQRIQMRQILKNLRSLNLNPGISVLWNHFSEWDVASVSFFLKLLEDWYIQDVYLNDPSILKKKINERIPDSALSEFNFHICFCPNIRTYLADHPDQISQILLPVLFSTSEYVIHGENWGQPVLDFFGHRPERISLSQSNPSDAIKIKDPELVYAVFLAAQDKAGRTKFTDVTRLLDRQKGQLILPRFRRNQSRLFVIRQSYLNAPPEVFNFLHPNHLNMVHHIFRARTAALPFSVKGIFYDFNRIYPGDLPPYFRIHWGQTDSPEPAVDELLTQEANETPVRQELSYSYGREMANHFMTSVFPELQAASSNRIFIQPDHPLIRFLPLHPLFTLQIEPARFCAETPYYHTALTHIKRAAAYRFNQGKNELPVVFGRLIPTETPIYELKHRVDLLFAAGVNHLILTSPDFRDECLGNPSQVLPVHDPNFNEYHQWFTYIHQLSNRLSTGASRPEVLVLFPNHDPASAQIYHTLDEIENAGLGYELADFSLFESNKSFSLEEGQINFKGKSFRIVFLPHAVVVSVPVLQKLYRFVVEGGILIALGILPHKPFPGESQEDFDLIKENIWFEAGILSSTSFKSHDSGGRAYFIPDTNKLSDLLTDLDKFIRLRVVSDPPGVKFMFRETDQHYVLFVVNPFKNKKATCTVLSEYRGRPFEWDFNRAESHPILEWSEQKNRLMMRINLDEAESRLILLDKKERSKGWQLVEGNADGLEIVEMGSRFLKINAWKRQPGTLYLVFRNNKRGKRIAYQVSDRLPILRLKNSGWFLDSQHYHGKIALGDHAALYPFHSDPIIYQKIVLLNEEYVHGQKLILNLGKLKNWCAVYINERFVDQRFSPPWHFDITKHVKPGENKLSIMVFPPFTNHLARNNTRFPVRSYGLWGPVKIFPYQQFQLKFS